MKEAQQFHQPMCNCWECESEGNINAGRYVDPIDPNRYICRTHMYMYHGYTGFAYVDENSNEKCTCGNPAWIKFISISGDSKYVCPTCLSMHIKTKGE